MFTLAKSGSAFALFLFCYGALTDFFDGYFARKNKDTSLKGAILDVLSDKVFVYLTLLGLILQPKDPTAAIIIMIWFTRDSILLITWWAMVAKTGMHFKALISGKIYAAAQFFFLFLTLLGQKWAYFYFKWFFLSGSIITCFSYFLYFRKHYLKDKPAKP